MIPQRVFEFRTFHHPTGQLFTVWMFSETYVWVKPIVATQDAEKSTVGIIALARAECALMQLTGCYDKTGVTIWEGDVLRAEYTFAHGSRDVDHSRYYYVTFHNGSFCYVPMGDTDLETAEVFYFSEYDTNRIYDSVVGNVYEHRHLLDLIGEQPLANTNPA